jgi:transcriptional regulator with XRE-family HTH domain
MASHTPSLGELILAERTKRGLDQHEAGAACGGVSNATISSWENDSVKTIKDEHLREIAKFLHKNVTELIDPLAESARRSLADRLTMIALRTPPGG